MHIVMPVESDMHMHGYMLRTTHSQCTKDNWIMNESIPAMTRSIILGSYEANSNMACTK